MWKIYPRKVAKKTALSVFKKIDIKEFDVIKKALQIFVTQNKNTQIKFIRQKNKGLNVSNNIALKLSKGKYIIRLDADDWLEKNALELFDTNNKLNANKIL